MLPSISFPEVFPLGLQEERPAAKFPGFACGEISPRVSSGPLSVCSGSMASSSSEVEGITDLLSFPLPENGRKPTIAAHHDQSLLIKQQQSADAEMQKHQQQYWPQLHYFPTTQGMYLNKNSTFAFCTALKLTFSQLPLVNLDEDLEDALGLFYPHSPLDFGDGSMPLVDQLHPPPPPACGGGSGSGGCQPQQTSPLMLPPPHYQQQQRGELDIPSSSGDDGDGEEETRKPRRRVGRPRAQPVRPPPAPISTEDAALTAAAEDGGGAAGPQGKKRGRGPKPKYVYATNDEALDARKERNRKAALESYYRKRQKSDALNQEIKKLQAENALLEKLALEIEGGGVVLEDATEAGLDAWLAHNA